MSARASVIRKIGLQHSSETRLVDNDNVIQAFPPDRSDHPFGVGILPGRVRSAQHFVDAKPGGRLAKYFAVNAVAVAQQKTRSRIPGEGLQELPGGPLATVVSETLMPSLPSSP